MTTQEKKYATYAATGVAILVIAYFVFRNKQESGGMLTDPTGNGGDMSQNPNTLPFNAKLVAENLYGYMNKFGTDEEAIIDELTKVNAVQFLQISNAFGRRNYNTLSGGNDWGGNLQPLKVWLKNELSAQEYSVLRLKYPNAL